MMQKNCVLDTQMELNTHRSFLWGSLGTQLQLEMIDYFGNFYKILPNAFIPANEICRYGPVIALGQANLKPDTAQTLNYDSLFMLTSQVKHAGLAT